MRLARAFALVVVSAVLGGCSETEPIQVGRIKALGVVSRCGAVVWRENYLPLRGGDAVTPATFPDWKLDDALVAGLRKGLGAAIAVTPLEADPDRAMAAMQAKAPARDALLRGVAEASPGDYAYVLFVAPDDRFYGFEDVKYAAHGMGLFSMNARNPFVHANCLGLLYDPAKGAVVRTYAEGVRRDVPVALALANTWTHDPRHEAAVKAELTAAAEIAGANLVTLLASEPPPKPDAQTP